MVVPAHSAERIPFAPQQGDLRDRLAQAERAFRAENTPNSPKEALLGLIIAGNAGLLKEPAARRAMAIAGSINAPIAQLLLQHAKQARAAGLEMRLVLAQQRSWRFWRAAPSLATVADAVGTEGLRLLHGPDASGYFEHGVFGMAAHWAGPKIGGRSWLAGRSLADDAAFAPFHSSPGGRRNAALAHSSFEAVWMAADPLN